ncbi:putative synaptonemal complex protein 2-like [Trypoxylus dichotomus]
MSGVAEIRLIPELVNKFAEEITVPILENITDPSIKIVCAKELIRSYNIIVASSEKSVREKLANTSRLYLFKLADLLCSCGDYEYQTCLVETIFRICPIDFIKAYASEFFPGTESLQQALIKFDVKNFDNSVRIFLRLVNNIFGNVYSFVADDILLDNVNIIPPTDSQGQKVELWIDCNRTSGTIGIYCDQYCLRNDSLSQISDGKGWELITIFADDIYLVDVKKPKDTLETEKLPTLFKFTLANEFHVQYPASESITKSKYLKVIVHDERIIEKLQKSVFPIMFKEKFQGGENKKSRMSDTLSLKPKTNSLKKRYNALCVRVKSQSIVSADTRSMKSLDDVMRVKNSKNIFVGAECISPSSTNLDVFIDNDMQIPETQYFSANEELDNDKNTKQESMGTKRISPNSTNLDVSFGNDIQIPETQYFSVDTELDNDKNTKQKVPVIEMSKIYQSCPIRNCNKKPLKKERVKVKFPFIRKQVPTRKKSFDPAFSPIYEGAESTRLEQNDSLSKSSYANQIKTDETETPEIITTPLRANRSKTKEQRYCIGQQFKPTPQSETIGDETVVKTSQSNILTTTEINHILNDSENHSDRKQGISKENNAQFEAALHGTSRFTEEIIEQQSQENLNQRNSEVVIHERNNKICKSEIFEDACEYFTSLWDEFNDKESELKELRNVQEELASNNKTNSSSTNYKSSESVEKLTVVGENIHESLDKNRSQNAVKNSQEGENILKEPVGDSIIAKELGNSQIDKIIEKNEKIESIMNSQKLQRPEIIADGFEKNNTEKANKKRHHQMQKTKSRMVEKPLRKETYEYRQDIPTCNPVEICTVKGSSDESLLKEKQSVKLYDKKQFSVAGDSVETKDISTTSKMIVQQTPNENVESHTKEGVIQGTSTCATTQIIANTNLVSNVALDNLEELVTVETQHAKADTVLSQKESIKVNLEVPQRVKDVEKDLKSNNSKEFVENKSVKGLELRKKLAIDDSGNMQNNEDKELAVNNSGNMKNNENKNIGSGKMKNIKSLKKNKRGTNTHELKRDQEDSETKFANKNVQLGSVIENVQRRTNGKPKRGLDANKNRNVLSVAESDNSILHDEEDVLLKSTLKLTQKQLFETEVLIKEETSVSVICNDDKKDSIQNIDTITTNTDLLEKGNTKINEKHEESGKVSSTPNQNVLSQKFDVNTEIIISSSQKSKSSTFKRKLSQSDTKLFVKKSKRFKLYDPNDFSYLENDESLNKDLTAIPQFEAKSTPNETLADLRKKKRQRSNKKKPKQKAKSRTQQVKKTSRPDRNSDILSNERDVSYQFDKIAQQEFSRKNYEKRTISSSISSESDDGSPKRIQVVAMVHPIREHTDNNRSRVNGDKNIQKARESIGDIQIENKKDSKLKQISTTSKQQTRKRNVSLDEGSTKLGRRQKELFDTFLKSFVEDINKTRISVREIHNSSKLARLRREKKQVKKPTKKRRLSSDDDFLINDNQLHHRKGQVKVNILENIVLKAANEEQYNECAEFEELPEAIESSLDTVNGDSVSEGRHSEIMWREMFKIFLLIKNVLIKYPPHNMKQNKYYQKLLKDILDVWKVVANNK